jgi:transposase
VKPTAPADRVLPSNTGPGPVTELAVRRPGELGTDTLERVGAAVLPPAPPTTKKNKGGRPSKLPRQLAAIIALRTEGQSDTQIAERLNLSVSTVRGILAKARKQLGFSDLIDRVEHRAVPTAVDNLIEGLDRGDKDYTLATLKGVGVFRNHSAVKNEGAPTENKNVLVVKIEMPAGVQPGELPTVAVGNIVGTPRALKVAAPVVEGEVVAAGT